jgi:hypothetical protein
MNEKEMKKCRKKNSRTLLYDFMNVQTFVLSYFINFPLSYFMTL